MTTRRRSDAAIKVILMAMMTSGFSWPEGKKAAVSLTYDDAIATHIDVAGPALNKTGLKGTFFLTCGSWEIQKRPDAWKALSAAGHELASHTVKHPCSKSYDFVKPGQALEDYDEAKMSAELDESIRILEGLTGKKGPFSFAYPCGNDFYGPEKASYVPLLKTRFTSSRSGGQPPADPTTVDLYRVPSFVCLENHSGKDLIAFAEKALSNGGWAVFMFHGVGGDYLKVSAEAHEELLAYLVKSQKDLWVTPFGGAVHWLSKSRSGN